MTEGWEALLRRMDPRPSGRCLAGISGGADSMALLHLMLLLREAGEAEVEVIHVNHGLRGREADGDEAFVRSFCLEKRVPVHAVRVDLGGRKDENTAREQRYAAFERVLRAEGIRTLVLAHQREDQAETLLMRLMRGAGPEGLRDMRKAETRNGYSILRPMLKISGQELRARLEADGIPWREDGSNRETRYLRNRIRMELLPRMEEIAPGTGIHLARAAALIGQDGDALDRCAEELLDRFSGPGWIGVSALRGNPAAVRSRALRGWWLRDGPKLQERGLSFEQTRRLEGLLEAPFGATVNLPAGWRARRRKERLVLVEPPAEREKP